MKKSAIIAASLIAAASVGASPRHGYVNGTNTNVILHAWSWSFNTIADNMKNIADAGYDFVQTSPANTCFIGEGGGKALYSMPGDSVSGKWYYYYQPTAQIAAELGLTVRAVEGKLYRIRKHLQSELGGVIHG